MKTNLFNIKKLERFLGGMKFAVILILLFTLFMIVGTFFESYFGTDYASRTIYKTFPFMILQFGMFISIFFAMLLRLPPRKKLYGFYAIHTGLIMIACGSFITWYAGIDGTLSLDPNSPNREVLLSDDVVKIIYHDEGKQFSNKLPYTAFNKNLNWEFRDIKIVNYFPFADMRPEWVKSKNSYGLNSSLHSSEYMIFNDNVDQTFTLSLHPEAQEHKSSLSMGLLNLHYLPGLLADCFKTNTKDQYIVWNSKTGVCFSPSLRGVEIKATSKDNKFFVIREDGKFYSFFPDLSPWPLDEQMKVRQGADYRVFSRKMFEDKPHLFLFGDKVSYYDKDAKEPKWIVKKFENLNTLLELPWMNFKLRLLKHSDTLVPSFLPVAVRPIQKNGSLIKGESRAMEIEVKGETYWVTNQRPITLLIEGKKVSIGLVKDSLTLPFEFVLTKFKMDKDPGTNSPASYESFVRVFTKKGPINSHVYMNNPFKLDGFTFYQASYSQDPETGRYSSTLSVNVDQGRPLKYLGSLILILGTIAHYLLNKSKYTKKKETKIFKYETA